MACFLDMEREKGLNKILYKTLSGIAVFLVAMNAISLICLHFYTVYFSLKVSGYLAGFLTFIAPGVATIYWLFAAWIKTGYFINAYSKEFIVYLAWLPMPLIFYYLASFFKER